MFLPSYGDRQGFCAAGTRTHSFWLKTLALEDIEEGITGRQRPYNTDIKHYDESLRPYNTDIKHYDESLRPYNTDIKHYDMEYIYIYIYMHIIYILIIYIYKYIY